MQKPNDVHSAMQALSVTDIAVVAVVAGTISVGPVL